MEDITKTGPVGLKGMKGLNQSPSASSQYFQNLQRMSATQLSSTYLPEATRDVGIQLGQAGYGDSTYDDAATRMTQVDELGELRAQEQPWYSKVVNGLTKGVVLAATTFLDGTVGLLVGAGQGIANMADDDPNTGFWSGLWDNDFSKAMQRTNENFEQWLPNYYTQEEQNSPWYENIFTANFLGDKFIKNLGFSVGAIYSGGVWSKALKVTKLPQIMGAVTKSSEMPAMITSAVGATISAVNEGRIEALNNSKDWFEYQKAQLDDEYRQRSEEALAEYEDTKGSLVGDMEGGFYDPAYVKYKETLAKEEKAYNEALGRLSEDRIKMGNADLLMNIPILATSNYLQFAKFYANGFKTARRTANIVGRAGEYTAGTTKRGAVWAATKGALAEGTEEISQKAASEISGTYYATDVNNFYKARTDRQSEIETLDWAKAFSQGINKTVNEGSSWEEFFIGSLTGMLGIPTFRGVRNSEGRFQSPVVLEGGAYNHWREYQDTRAREQEIVDYMNNRVQSPEFLNYYQGLIRHNKYQRDMDQAAEDNDEFNFKNAEHAQLVSDIIMFDNAGKLEDLITLIDSAYDTSDANLQSIVENTTSTTEDGKKVGPFIDSNGNPMYATPEGKREMIDKLTQNKDAMSKTIDSYVKAKNSIDISTGQQLSDSQLEELAWMKTQLTNWSDRAVEMSGEVKQVIGKVLGNLDAFVRFQDAIRTEEGQSHAGLTDRYNRADKNVRSAERAIATLKAVRSLDDVGLAANLSRNPDFVRGLMREVSLLDDNVIGADEKEEILGKLEDIVKLGNAVSVYNAKFKEYLDNPGQQVADHERVDQENAQAVQEESNATLRQRLDQATSVAQFRQILNEEQDAVTRDQVLQAMDAEGNQVAKNYKETQQYDNELKKALKELGETDQVYQDAMTLWQDQFNLAENLKQIANPNSVSINNEEAFMEDSEGDVDMAESRFQNARYALQRAMSKVNNDIKFKNRFSKEYRRPVDEPVRGKGVDKDSTGDSGTSTVPHVNPNVTPVETPSVPVGNITPEMVATENRDANRRVETQRTLDQSQQGQRRYYRPAVPELHIEASKEGDFRPFDTVVAEKDPGADFSSIYSYLRDNGAFSYVNAAKLKPGDTLGFMIDPDFNDHTIFLVDTRNNQIVGSIDESDASVARYEGLENLIKKVRDEFEKRGEEATGKFFATPQTRVSKMMVGRIPYTSEDRSLADIPGVLDGEAKPILGIIKNGTLTTNEKIDDRLIIKPVDMAKKEGRLYLLIPNAAGTYSPAAVRVKHFNNQEFNLDDATVANTPIGKGINEALDRLSDATSQDDVSIAMKELAQDIYLQDVMVTWFDAKAGSGIVISKKVRKPDGTYEMVTINGQEQIKEDKYTIYYQSSRKSIEVNGVEYTYEVAKDAGIDMSIFGQPREASDIRRDILGTLLRFNLPLQVSISRINESNYNNRIIKSNILTSNLREAKVIGNWFTTDYFDNQGNLQRAINPSSVKPAPGRRTTSPVGGTEGVIQGTRVSISGTPYIVDLKHSVAMNERTGEKRAFSAFNSDNLIDMAWAQETFGDATESSIMTDNKVITPKGRVLDRNTGYYLPDAEAQKIKDKITGRNQDREKKIAQSKRVIADIYENQKKVDKTRTDSQFYYILEDDGQYHEYSRVHNRLGDNWLGERTETENSKRALEAGSAVDKVIRDFFTSKETPVRPETLSDSAFIDLISRLTEIKSKMEQLGETFMADNIVLFQKYTDGTRVAGEVDILSVDKDGNFKIYDVKTSRYSFGDRYFTEKSSKQRMSTKDYYTLQLSAYQNLFESQYGMRPTRLAILPFVLTYDKNNKISSIAGEKGIPITYNPAVNVPLASAVQVPQQQYSLPIFDATIETMNPENRVLPENAFEEGGEIGFYEKDGKLYSGYLKKIGEIEVTFDSGQKAMVPIHVTKVRDRGFGREGEFGSTSEYLTVFPNGKAISTKTNDTSDAHATEIIMKALSAKPEKVLSLSNEKTQIHNPRELEELEFEQRSRQYSQEATQPSGASRAIQREDAVNKKSAKRTRHKLRAIDSTRPTWNREKELAWLENVLPQLSEQDRVRVVEGLIQVADNGPVAWGMFSDGIVTLSDIAAEGTAYHEAFHVVFNLMMNDSERESLFNEARQMFGNKSLLELEEDMAEGFREYVVSQETRDLGRKILDFFKNLFAKITNWKYVKPSLTSYYRMINQGKYKNYSLGLSSISRLREEQYTSEMQSIKDKAIANGTFMKAPNGNPTNLTERQWLQVRTKNFINWFGDWINKPKEASKVIDENGEPLVVYHGTPNKWNILNSSKFSSNTDEGYYGRGLYLSSVENKAAQYGDIMSLFVNIRNPIRVGMDKNITMVEAAKNVKLAELFNRNNAPEELNRFDGVLYSGSEGIYEEIVVPGANQIKSATNNIGEFSTTNDDIRYRIVPNSSWSAVDIETRETLKAKGWTQEKFDSISQKERDQAVECVGL